MLGSSSSSPSQLELHCFGVGMLKLIGRSSSSTRTTDLKTKRTNDTETKKVTIAEIGRSCCESQCWLNGSMWRSTAESGPLVVKKFISYIIIATVKLRKSDGGILEIYDLLLKSATIDSSSMSRLDFIRVLFTDIPQKHLLDAHPHYAGLSPSFNLPLQSRCRKAMVS